MPRFFFKDLGVPEARELFLGEDQSIRELFFGEPESNWGLLFLGEDQSMGELLFEE